MGRAEELTLSGTLLRKQAMQLQLLQQTGQALAKSSSDILGYLHHTMKTIRKNTPEVERNLCT